MLCRAYMIGKFSLPEHGHDRFSSFCMPGNEKEAGVYVVLSDLAQGFDEQFFLPGQVEIPARTRESFQTQEMLLILPVFCLAPRLSPPHRLLGFRQFGCVSRRPRFRAILHAAFQKWLGFPALG